MTGLDLESFLRLLRADLGAWLSLGADRAAAGPADLDELGVSAGLAEVPGPVGRRCMSGSWPTGSRNRPSDGPRAEDAPEIAEGRHPPDPGHAGPRGGRSKRPSHRRKSGTAAGLPPGTCPARPSRWPTRHARRPGRSRRLRTPEAAAPRTGRARDVRPGPQPARGPCAGGSPRGGNRAGGGQPRGRPGRGRRDRRERAGRAGIGRPRAHSGRSSAPPRSALGPRRTGPEIVPPESRGAPDLPEADGERPADLLPPSPGGSNPTRGRCDLRRPFARDCPDDPDGSRPAPPRQGGRSSRPR